MDRIKRAFAALAVALLLGIAVPATTSGCADALVGPDTAEAPAANAENDPDTGGDPPPNTGG